jgi:hypothetical protein
MGASWNMNTDIEKAFRLVLDTAVNNKLAQEDMPKSIIIISDMEFDQATSSGYGRAKKDYYTHMKELFANAGYELPKIVYWNVDARQNTFHAEMKDGVQFASGQATSVFKSLISGASLTAYDLMLEVLNSPAYECIKV